VAEPESPSGPLPSASPDPERDWVMIEREHLGLLLAASLAVLQQLMRDRPEHARTWQLAQAVSAAERALLGDSL
jgi:hypothetical protein